MKIVLKGLKESAPKKEEKVGQEIARYEPPSHGPFECGRCEYFKGPSSCAVVEGEIEPKGCCVLFEGPDSEED